MTKQDGKIGTEMEINQELNMELSQLSSLSDSDTMYQDEDTQNYVCIPIGKNEMECCICYEQLTGPIFNCCAVNHKVHNICGECEWNLRRMKSRSGHTKKQKCPQCRIEGKFMRNDCLEGQIREFTKPCPNHSQGCTKRFSPWDHDLIKEHMNECRFEEISCPICEQKIDGCNSFLNHIREGKCKYEFVEALGQKNKQKQTFTEILSNQHTFSHSPKGNYVMIFINKENIYFDICVISLNGNLRSINQHCHISISDLNEQNVYEEQLLESSTYESIKVPTVMSFSSNMKSLATDEPVPWDHYFVGEQTNPKSLMIKYFTLEEVLSIGCTLDCRDFHGKWYEAEILNMVKESCHSGTARNFETSHTRILVHYLGYSSNYDEWFDLGTDMARIAMSGTYTVGPNLRTIRRSQMHHSRNRRVSEVIPHRPRLYNHFPTSRMQAPY